MCSANNRSGGDPLHGNPFQCHHVLTQPRDIPNCLSGANAILKCMGDGASVPERSSVRLTTVRRGRNRFSRSRWSIRSGAPHVTRMSEKK